MDGASERSTAPTGSPSRRRVLAGSGLGITTFMLPSAAAAASVLSAGFAPSTQVAYEDGDAPIVSWIPFAIATQTSGTTFTARPSDYRLETLVASADQRPNPTAFGGADSNIADGGISYSQFGDTATTTDWIVRNTSTQFDVDDAPYVEYALTVAADRTAEVRSLVVHSFRLGQDLALGLAFYRSTDGFSTFQIRRTADPSNQYRQIVVDLGGIAVTGGTTLAVRMYVFGTASQTNSLFVRARNESVEEPTPRNGLEAGDAAPSTDPDPEDPSVVPVSLPSAAVSFIGQDVTPA